MYIICGENIPESSKRLSQIIESKKKAGDKIINLDISSIKLETLRQELMPTDLFGNSNFVCLTGLFSTAKKKLQKQTIDFLKKNSFDNLVLYETKAVHPSTLRSFKSATVENFKISSQIFSFLEKLSPNQKSVLIAQYQQLLGEGNKPEYLFAMILRQTRLMISMKFSPSKIKLPAFVVNKLKAQTSHFSPNQLLNLHHKLYLIDTNIKSGKTQLDLNTLLENFFLQF